MAHRHTTVRPRSAGRGLMVTVVIILSIVGITLPTPASAADSTWHVAASSGSDTADCGTADDPCATIGHALGLSDADDIIVIAAGDYTENLVLDSSVTLRGTDGATLSPSDDGSPTVIVTAGATISIESLTVNGSNPAGIIIQEQATAHLSTSTISGGFFGIALTDGTATIADSTVTAAQHAGVMVSQGHAIITDSAIIGNDVIGTLTTGPDAVIDITDTILTGNGFDPLGMAYGGVGDLGGGSTSLTRVRIENNLAGAVVAGGVLTVVDSVIADNGSGGERIENRDGVGIAGIGDVFIMPEGSLRPTINVSGSLISGNRIGFDLFESNGLVTNSTIVDNAWGGVLLSSRGGPEDPLRTVVITHTTLADNGTTLARSGTLGLQRGNTVVLAGSVVQAPGGPAPVCNDLSSYDAGTFIDAGHNVLSDTSCGTPAETTLTDADAELSPLADNGGPTPSKVPAPTSPAVDLIPTDTVVTVPDGVPAALLCATGSVDQRAVERPQGNDCEAGSVELVPPPVEITTESLPDGTQDEDYATTLAAVGGVGSFRWSITDGDLPDGLTLAADNGEISGVPSASGSFTVTVTVTDELGTTASKPFTIEIAPAPVTSPTPTPTPPPTTPPPPLPSATSPSPAETTSVTTSSPTTDELAETGAPSGAGPVAMLATLALLLGAALLAARHNWSRPFVGRHRG